MRSAKVNERRFIEPRLRIPPVSELKSHRPRDQITILVAAVEWLHLYSIQLLAPQYTQRARSSGIHHSPPLQYLLGVVFSVEKAEIPYLPSTWSIFSHVRCFGLPICRLQCSNPRYLYVE